VVPVEGVKVRLASTPGGDNTLADEAVQAVADALFGVAPCYLVHLPAGEVGFGTGQHGKHISVHGRRYDSQRPAQVHARHLPNRMMLPTSVLYY
jgi:hypothetical protein